MICPSAGAAIGGLTASINPDLPDGAVVDSMVVFGNDLIGYPVEVQLMYQPVGTSSGWLIAGDGSYSNISSWSAVGVSNYLKKSWVGSSHSIDKRNNDYYFRIMSNSTTQTCPTAGAEPIGFGKAYIVYHLSSL